LNSDQKIRGDMIIKKIRSVLKVWYFNLDSVDNLRKGDMVVFPFLKGEYVPTTPYPQKFIVSKIFLDSDLIEIIPLTMTSLVKNIVQNFITMNIHRLFRLLMKIGIVNVRSIRDDIVSESNITFCLGSKNKSKILDGNEFLQLVNKNANMTREDFVIEMVNSIKPKMKRLGADDRAFVKNVIDKNLVELSESQLNWLRDIYLSSCK